MTKKNNESLLSELDFFVKNKIKEGHSYQAISEAMGYTMLRLGPHDNEEKRRIILEGTYAQIAKVLGRDASVKLK